ncbi:LysM peptidoglycan-binding domain-containing protein [Arthrobacter sp. BB-1]|uniref:LysM peptidoglycan-binding domain-containing protein n=1 Tax=unclassified Arthrobacter TaxID=235627 RepID=UPI00111285CF|nr:MULTISPECIES: LysM domain-containing protein [unclassified Arthrobacter]TNB71632.1 LysM peptidoglycan-binding domain-containing protein [Arthrobacter sp. BB-1]
MARAAWSRLSADAAGAAAVLLLGILLCLISSGLLAQWKDSSARLQEPGVEELLATAAGAAGTGIVAWWFTSLACAAASAVLARKGRTRAAAATRKLSPAFMQRLVLGALSVQLLSGPVAHASVPAPGPEWAPTQVHSSSAPATAGAVSGAVPAADATAGGAPTAGIGASSRGPAWTAPEPVPVQSLPVGKETPASAGNQPGKEAPAGSEAPVQAGKEHSAVVATTPPPSVHPGWQPVPPVVNPGMLAAPASRAPAEATAAEAEAVTVQAGDTLWDIAARALGHGASDVDIALQWPRWYQANAALIGQNPDVLLPGQILQPPSSAHK